MATVNSEATATVLAVEFAKARRRASFAESVESAEMEKQEKAAVASALVEAETLKAWTRSYGRAPDVVSTHGDLYEQLGATHDEMRTTVVIKPLSPLGIEGSQRLAELCLSAGVLRCLEVLNLAHSALGDGGTAAVADALQPCIPLHQLDLAGNSIKDVGAASVARAMSRGAVPRLLKLSLKSNDIHDAGAAALAGASHDALEWLALGCNQIADEGGAALAAALGARRLGHLRRLSLDNNRLGDGAMTNLAKVLEARPTLDELYVECNPASDEATRRVQMLFGCEGQDEKMPAARAGARAACEAAAMSCHKSGCVCM